jgi:hypothetical protein
MLTGCKRNSIVTKPFRIQNANKAMSSINNQASEGKPKSIPDKGKAIFIEKGNKMASM